MIKTQANDATGVLQLHQQTAAFTKHHISAAYFSLKYRWPLWLQAADGGNAAAVFVAKRQVKVQVCQAENVQLMQLLSQLWANAFQLGQLGEFIACARGTTHCDSAAYPVA